LVSHNDGEHGLRKFKNRVLSKIFGAKMEEVAGEQRRLSNEELYDPYFSPSNIWVITSRRMRWVGDVAHIGERCIKGFGGETQGKGTNWMTYA
jgi:hypothetical protein